MKIAVWVPLGMDVLSTLTFGRIGIDCRSILCRFYVTFYVRFFEIEAVGVHLTFNPSSHPLKK